MPRDGSLAQCRQPQGARPPDLDASDTAGCWRVPEQELPPGGTGTMPQGHRWGQLGGPAPRHCPRASLRLRLAVLGRLGMGWHSSASPLSPRGMHQTTGLQTLCGAGSIPGAEPGGNGVCWWGKHARKFPSLGSGTPQPQRSWARRGKRGLEAASPSLPCPPRSPCSALSRFPEERETKEEEGGREEFNRNFFQLLGRRKALFRREE